MRHMICQGMVIGLTFLACLSCLSCDKKAEQRGTVASTIRLSDTDKTELNALLSQLVDALRREDVEAIRRLMPPNKAGGFTLESLRRIDEFRGNGWFRNYMGRSPQPVPSIGNMRSREDKNLVRIEGLGVVCFFKQIDGKWYFDGWAQ